MNVRAYSKVKTLLARISLFPLRAHYSVEARISPMSCAHFSVFTRIFPSSCAHFSVVARKIPENFDAHFSFLRARKIPRILVAAQSAGAHAHFSYTPDPRHPLSVPVNVESEYSSS
jgi:hypothetical protein